MLTAKVRFLTNNLVADLTCRSSDLQTNLQSIGVLTPVNLIRLDNSRTLQIHLKANNDIGERIIELVNLKKDTLGRVQRLCRYVYCMNSENRGKFVKKIENGEIKTVVQGIKFAEKMRKNMSIKR